MIGRMIVCCVAMPGMFAGAAAAQGFGSLSCSEVSRIVGDSTDDNHARIDAIIRHTRQRFLRDDAAIVQYGDPPVAGSWNESDMSGNIAQVTMSCGTHPELDLDQQTDAVFSGAVAAKYFSSASSD